MMSTAAATFAFTPVRPQLLQQQAVGASRNTLGGSALPCCSVGGWVSGENEARPDGITQLH